MLVRLRKHRTAVFAALRVTRRYRRSRLRVTRDKKHTSPPRHPERSVERLQRDSTVKKKPTRSRTLTLRGSKGRVPSVSEAGSGDGFCWLLWQMLLCARELLYIHPRSLQSHASQLPRFCSAQIEFLVICFANRWRCRRKNSRYSPKASSCFATQNFDAGYALAQDDT